MGPPTRGPTSEAENADRLLTIVGPVEPGEGPLEGEDLLEVVVGGRIEMEGEAHGPKQVGKLLGPDRPDLNPHQASGVTPAAVRAFCTSVSKPVAEVVYAVTAVFLNSPVSVLCMPSSASWAAPAQKSIAVTRAC